MTRELFWVTLAMIILGMAGAQSADTAVLLEAEVALPRFLIDL